MDLFWAIIYPLILVGIGGLLSIFSKDIRQWVIEKYMSYRYRRASDYNKKIDKKIALLRSVKSPIIAIGLIGGDILRSMIAIFVTLYFGIFLLLKIQAFISLIGFFVSWYLSMVIIGQSIETAYQISDIESAIGVLEARKKPEK